jgi:hypothetical protein
MHSDSEHPKRRHINADQKRALKSATLQTFVQQYARKAHKGFDPNDRRYDREVERAIKHLTPETLDSLLRDDEA